METYNLPDGLKKIIVTERETGEIISRLAKEITRDYAGKKLLVCGILKGCFVFMSDLIRKIELPLEVSFIKASSYGSGREPGTINVIEFDNLEKYKGYNILVVDDILDTGNTFCYLERYLKDRGFSGVSFCAFLDKPERRRSPAAAKYTGRQIEDEFVVGYGLDFNEKYRNLPFVAAVSDKQY
ncbi:MAG: hypoxanthine phosphoribosyltransferase [Oscillospiraceae bacterium]|nr:hypoxanthine phosphoribosyltransferase [Oscillospiraceae bacterium]